jgi:hypothetical protein
MAGRVAPLQPPRDVRNLGVGLWKTPIVGEGPLGQPDRPRSVVSRLPQRTRESIFGLRKLSGGSPRARTQTERSFEEHDGRPRSARLEGHSAKAVERIGPHHLVNGRRLLEAIEDSAKLLLGLLQAVQRQERLAAVDVGIQRLLQGRSIASHPNVSGPIQGRQRFPWSIQLCQRIGDAPQGARRIRVIRTQVPLLQVQGVLVFSQRFSVSSLPLEQRATMLKEPGPETVRPSGPA